MAEDSSEARVDPSLHVDRARAHAEKPRLSPGLLQDL